MLLELSIQSGSGEYYKLKSFLRTYMSERTQEKLQCQGVEILNIEVVCTCGYNSLNEQEDFYNR